MPEALKYLKRPFSFAVVSDTHFVTRSSIDPDLGGTRPLTAEGCLESVMYSLAPTMDGLRRLKPDFMVLTGDVAEPAQDHDQHQERFEAALDFFATLDIPLVVARGNQDDTSVFDHVVSSRTEAFLGHPSATPFFSFEVDDTLFVVLDTAFWTDKQCQWLESELAERFEDRDRRIFVVGHHPIWTVARAFFSVRKFQTDILSLLDRYPIDAYFCGHSHNQNILLHRTGGPPVLQCMGALIGLSDEPPLPLDQIQSLLPVPDNVIALWPGYLENTAPGWFMGYVEDGQAGVEWHHLNQGAEAVVRWYQPGDLKTFWTMEQVPAAQLIPSDLQRIRRATLRFCAWASTGDARVFLNGDELGPLPQTDYFASGRLNVPPDVIAYLQMKNKLYIEPVEECEFAIGNLVLEVVLPGGRHVRSLVYDDIYTWSDKWDVYGLDRLRKLPPDSPLTAILSFR